MPSFHDEEYNAPFSLKAWGKLLPFLRPQKKHLILILIFNVICGGVDIAYPLLQRYAIDHFIVPRSTQGLDGFAMLYLVLLVLQTVCVVVFCRASMTMEMEVGRELKRAAFVHLQKLSFSYYNVTPVGYMMARVMSDTGRIGGMLSWGVMDMMWGLVYVSGAFVTMLLLNWRIALMVITIVPFIAVLTVVFQKRILQLNRRVRKVNSTMTGAFNEGIMGARTSKTLVIEDKNAAEFGQITQELYLYTVRASRLNAIYLPLILFASSLATVFVLTSGGNLVLEGVMELGMLSAFVTYAINIFEPVQNIARLVSDFIATQANIERVSSLLETKPQIADREDVVEKYGTTFLPRRENWEPIRGDITFDHVWFRYPDGGENILEDFCLQVPAGTTVAIVGETGAGKSTLVNLACRFFEPTKGGILIDGVDYRERSQLWLHQSLGYVLQNPHLFSGTVRENIRYGRLDATDGEIEEAAKMVSAHDVIAAMEKGYDSDVGENGDRLSTGEKQLISFARAVLANPRIFVLDEATSSIDTQTEQRIQNAISHLLQDRTSFLIAHRLSTIRQADIILVVQDGRIIERGSHRELLLQKGHYYTLYKKQFEQEAGQKILVRQSKE